MTYQDRVDIDTLYDLVYDSQSEQLKVVTKEEFEQLFGSISSFKDMQELYYDKSEVYLKILEVLKDAGVITDEQYNELVSRIESVSTVANRADGKADDLRDDVGTVTGDDLQTQVTTVNGTASDAYGLADTANGNASTALSRANTANSNASTALSTAGNAQTTANTANNNASTALSTANTANGNASTALSTANTADGKANQLRTDVGTVNQPNDGSLQQQITYLPSYISKLVVSEDGINWQNVAHLNRYGSGWIGVFPSELAYKQLRDDDYIEYTIEITDPDNNVSTYTDRITSYVTVSRMNYFDKNGIYIISCENLKCVVAVGDYTKEHTHSISEVNNLQTSLNGKANSTHSHPISDVDDLQLELNTKASLIHTHNISEVTNLQTSLNGKANSTHSHSISEVTNLQTSLNGKANSTHSHTSSEISDLSDSFETAFPYSANATDYSTEQPVKIIQWGRVITISGIMKLLTSVGASADVVIGNMVSVLPSNDVYAPWTGNSRQGYIKIATDGTVTLANRSGSSTSMNSGQYFVIDCTYII